MKTMDLDAIEEKLKGNREALIQLWENSGQQEKIDQLKAEEFREVLKMAKDIGEYVPSFCPDKSDAGPLKKQLRLLKRDPNPLISEEEIQRAAEILFEYSLRKNEPWNALRFAYQYKLGYAKGVIPRLTAIEKAAIYLLGHIIGKRGHDRSSGIAVIRQGWANVDKELIGKYLQDTYKDFLSRDCTELLPLVTEFPQYFSEEQKEIAKALVGTRTLPIYSREFWKEDWN